MTDKQREEGLKHIEKHKPTYIATAATMGTTILAVVGVLTWFGWSVADIAAVPSVIKSDKVNSERWVKHLEAMENESEQTSRILAAVEELQTSVNEMKAEQSAMKATQQFIYEEVKGKRE